MRFCTSCSRQIPEDSRLCPYCSVAVGRGLATPTGPQAEGPSLARMPTLPAKSTWDSEFVTHGQFLPGTKLTERYRVVSMIGKGGMGEVYRADDLELGQSVALKFLPREFAADPQRLERFRKEVRIARQIAHPNVCRVYDIAQADGRYFLSMEYVDGEDLSAVLRRMGRPSKEKAIEISRQLCAGLAAAHANDVLHRDLKPANVMIDGRGRVRITDFGLAGMADSFRGGEIRAGTPAYMSPEQLSGHDVSVRSDLYALGLVLYEVYTGKRMFETNSVEELQRLHDSGSRMTPSNVVDDIDPAVERVILRCLEKDPRLRPSSALAVAAALPGADPLAAALAAGETPSPEMVAASGSTEGMHPALAIFCFLLIVSGALASIPLCETVYLTRLVPLPKPPEVLADRAAEILTHLGHKGTVADTARGFDVSWDHLQHIEKTDRSQTRWGQLASVRPSPMYFWYRQSPQAMIPASSEDLITQEAPPLMYSGEAMVQLDPTGRLTRLSVSPAEREKAEATSAPSSTNWSLLFADAQIDERLFARTDPQWTPEKYCDERAAWEGHFAGQPSVSIRLEAGAFRGKPTYFRIIEPWTKAWRTEEESTTTGEYVAQAIIFGILTLLLLGGVLMARRNLRLRRADAAGARRVGIALFCLVSVGWLLLSDHVPVTFVEFLRIRFQVAKALLTAVVIWLWYVSLEPHVRRRWPGVLVSWTRLLGGRLGDPLVGRDILVGGLFALGLNVIRLMTLQTLRWCGEAPPMPLAGPLEFLRGPRFQIGSMFDTSFSAFFAMLILFLFLGAILLVKRQWLAMLLLVGVDGVISFAFQSGGGVSRSTWITAASESAWMFVHLIVLLRFGLLASVFLWFFGYVFNWPAAFGLSGWPAGATWLSLIFITAVAGYGCITAMAGRPLFKDELAEA